VTEGSVLSEYLAAAGGGGHGDNSGARLVRGQFHDVVLLDDVAYRFPRDEESRRLLPARGALLSVLGNCRLPVAIPGLLSKAALSQPLGRSHVALRRLPGQPIEHEQITGALALSAVICDLAVVLDRLSELGADETIQAAVPRSDRHRWEQFASEVSAVLFPLMSTSGRRRAEAELNRVLTVDPVGDALVHGDLGGTNLVWSFDEPEPRLTGILDWDEAHIGNQADDLASIAVTFGWPLARRLDAMRHAGDTPTVCNARVIAATFALQQALPAALSGDASSLADGLITYRDPS
jgi:aminoglycoside phosphotransferase (APT) family kinase protein